MRAFTETYSSLRFFFVGAMPVMVYTALQNINSKKPCPVCQEHKLTTNSTAKVDEIMHYRCLHCGNEFFEDAHDRRISDRSARTRSAGEPSMGLGTILLVLLVTTILAISLYGEENRQQNNSQPLSQVELSARLVG